MPVDPTISLHAEVPNPLSTIGSFADIQNKLNQNRLFQQTFAARQRAGQILAGAPDLDIGLTQLYQDPTTAAFAPEIVNQVRQGEQTFADIGRLRAETQGLQQTQFETGLKAVLAGGMPAIINDPSENSWNNAVQPYLAGLSPSAKQSVGAAMDSIKRGLLGGLPSDPAQARLVVKQRAAALGLGAGLTPEAQKQISGWPEIINQGNVQQPVIQQQPPFGAGPIPVGPQFPTGAPPSYQKAPGDVTIPAPSLPGQFPSSASGGAGALGSPGNPAMSPSKQDMGPVPGPGSNALGGVQPSRAPGPAAASAPPVDNTLAGNGQPLFPPGIERQMISPSIGTGVGGLKVMSAAQQGNAEALQKEFSEGGLRAFNNANSTMGSLEETSAALDQMQKKGGFLAPGAGANSRVAIAKAINMMAGLVGEKEPFDPSTVGAAEDATKVANRLGIQFLTTMLGNQREAAQTINNITTKAVPGIENTFMGGKLVIESLKAATQRAIDQRNWENKWQSLNQGNLNGADEAFNRKFPAESYANAVLSKFGLGKSGFASPAALKAAVQSNFLTPKQAAAIGREQFPDFRGQ